MIYPHCLPCCETRRRIRSTVYLSINHLDIFINTFRHSPLLAESELGSKEEGLLQGYLCFYCTFESLLLNLFTCMHHTGIEIDEDGSSTSTCCGGVAFYPLFIGMHVLIWQ